MWWRRRASYLDGKPGECDEAVGGDGGLCCSERTAPEVEEGELEVGEPCDAEGGHASQVDRGEGQRQQQEEDDHREDRQESMATFWDDFSCKVAVAQAPYYPHP